MYSFDIDKQPADKALLTFAKQANHTLIFSSALAQGYQANALHGYYTLTSGLDDLLANTGLCAIVNESGQLKIRSDTDALCTNTYVATEISPVVKNEEGIKLPVTKVERIAVTGSHIRAGAVSKIIPVSLLSKRDIARMGVDSSEDLMLYLAENGQNYFSDAENIGGGVNAARGDISAYNLRNLGTGNTLVLLNGRRLVSAATYQTEIVGGSAVPVNSVNTNTIPVANLSQLEVLREGASAIYGADAVAGVVNHIFLNDFEGFEIRTKWSEYDNLPRDEQSLSLKWGNYFNQGRTNISVYFDYYQHDRVNSQDDKRWANSDFTASIPANSTWVGNANFDLSSTNSLYGQFDVISEVDELALVGLFTDSNGEFEVYPIGDARCQYMINTMSCGAVDGQGTYRYNPNLNRDLSADLARATMSIFINHEFANQLESFTELFLYHADSNLIRHGTTPLATSKLRVGAQNYWNPLGPCGSVNRLSAELIGTAVPCEGLALEIDNYRFAELPRYVENRGESYRFLQGLRGRINDWDWESAVSFSKERTADIAYNRVSNSLIQAALNDSSPTAYNPFSGGINSNIEQALIDVKRLGETSLSTFDIKFSNLELIELPAGSIAFLAGFEYRKETFLDDRDDRLDGSIVFTDWDGDSYPYVSDVVNSSPTGDSQGQRKVSSLFTEWQIPLFNNLELQVALRYENFSDVGNTTVGKFAFAYRPWDKVLLRSSWSEAFRAPNLVTINEDFVTRTNIETDWTCTYAAEHGGDPQQERLNCDTAVQRIASGSKELIPEQSDNASIGLVVNLMDNLTLALDYWSIKKVDTIGLLGEANQSLLDLSARLEKGPDNCATTLFNTQVIRQPVTAEEVAIYSAAGLCPAGAIQRIEEHYVNLDTRLMQGYDIGLYYYQATSYGNFNFKYNGSILVKYQQQANDEAAQLLQAQASGIIPRNYPVVGFLDLRGRDGNQAQRHAMQLHWDLSPFGASLSANRIGSFYQSDVIQADGSYYAIPAMTTYNATFDYKFNLQKANMLVRAGIKNLTNARAPLAVGYFGYFADAHSDFGRSVYLELKASF